MLNTAPTCVSSLENVKEPGGELSAVLAAPSTVLFCRDNLVMPRQPPFLQSESHQWHN